MPKITILLIVCGISAAYPQMLVKSSEGGVLMSVTGDSAVGIGTTNIVEKLDVNGAIHLGDTKTSNAGTIRWTGVDFEGYNGNAWQSLTETGSGLWDQSGSDIYYSTGNVGIGLTPSHPLHVGVESRFDEHVTLTGKGISAGMTSVDLQGADPHPFMDIDLDWTTGMSNFGKIIDINFDITGSEPYLSMTNPNGLITIRGEVNHTGGSVMHGNPWGNYFSSTQFNAGNVWSNDWAAYKDTPYFRGAAVQSYSSYSTAPRFDVAPSNIEDFVMFHGAGPPSSDDTIENLYGLRLQNIKHGQNNYAIHISDPGDTTAYALHAAGGRSFFGGNVGIGTTDPKSALHIYGQDNKLLLAFDGTNRTKFTTENTGALVINPANESVFINDINVDKNTFAKTGLLVHGGTEPTQLSSTDPPHFGIVADVTSTTHNVTGVYSLVRTEHSDKNAVGVGTITMGFQNASVKAVSAMANSFGAEHIYAGDFHVFNSWDDAVLGIGLKVNASTGTGSNIQTLRGIDLSGWSSNNDGSVTNSVGIYINETIDIGTGSQFALYSGSRADSYMRGNVGIGTDTPQRKLHVSDVMRLEPRATAPSDARAGDMYFDSGDNKLKVYDGSVWQVCW